MGFDSLAPCDLDFLVCERISLWEQATFGFKNIFMCQHSWCFCFSFSHFFFWIRGSQSPPGVNIKLCLGVFLHGCCCWSLLCVCVFDHRHYQLLSSGWETPTPRPPFLSFHISISFFVLLSPQVAYVRVGGVSADISCSKKGHTLVPSISAHLYLSLLQDSGLLANQIP